MAALENNVFKSGLFIFRIGDSRVEYHLHVDIIAKQSPALNALVNGSMAEAADGHATFEDVEEETFLRFCQFAYTGNYATPPFIHEICTETTNGLYADAEVHDVPQTDFQPPSSESVTGSLPHNAWANRHKNPTKIEPTKMEKPSKNRLLRQSLDDQLYDRGTKLQLIRLQCQVRANSASTEDYSQVFLTHAKLYVFAEKWGITGLRTLALSKIHETLTKFTLYASRRADIVQLLQFAYSNDHTPDRHDAVDDLRSLVMLYIVCEVESFLDWPEFMAIIGEGGELAQDFVRIMRKRLD